LTDRLKKVYPFGIRVALLQDYHFMQVGQRLRELREKRGWTQGDVERASGMLRAYISRVELGRTVPSVESIERFAAILDVPTYEVFREGPTVGIARSRKDSTYDLLARYIVKLSAPDRDFILKLARRLAK
jgi:transcriptional regulator with XRE-family HTH domain